MLNRGNLRIDDISDEFSRIDLAYFTKENPEGPAKFYNYLLLHPSRLNEIVPPYSIEKFRTFVESVFYVGKGTGLRFLDHFKEAIAKVNNSQRSVCQVKLHDVIPLSGYMSTHVPETHRWTKLMNALK